MAEKFNRKATNIENWASGRADELQRNDDLEEANLAGIQVCGISLLYICVHTCTIYYCLCEIIFFNFWICIYNCVCCLQALQKIHQTFETDLQAENGRVEGLASIAKELT